MKKFKLFLFAAMLLGGVGLHASNTITYTAPTQQSGHSGSLNEGRTTFGPAITSHTFSNGTGTITCSGEITKIGDYAFYNCSDLTSITIPNSVKTIGDYAFEYGKGLTLVEIPNSVTTIGGGAFGTCSSLTSVTIGNSVTTIGNSAFYKCSSLTSITIPNSVKSIGSNAFATCHSLTSVTIGNSVTTIGYSAFEYCRGLTSITIPNSVTTIEEHAFADCSSLTSVTIGNSVTTIGGYAFARCTGLTSVTVSWTNSESIVPIASSVFGEIANGAGPSGATLYVLNGTKEYYQQAEEWKNFGNIVEYINTITYTASAKLPGYNGSLAVGATTFGSAITSHEFSNGTGTITCSGKITQIGEAAFLNCTGLTSIEIPNSVDSIRLYAFQGCTGLTSIEIPNSVIRIRGNAFWACSGLTSVTVFWTDSASIAPIASSSFGEIANGAGRSGATLHVPNGTAALYQQADEWNKFGRIECDLIKVNNLWYRPLNVRTVNLIVNQDTTATGERIPYSGDAVIPNTIIYNGNNSIAAIEDSVFYNAKLTSLTVLTDIPLPCEQYTFLGQDKSIPVYVLDVDAFKRAQYWNKFTNIQFYAPYRDEAKQKLIDAANSVPEEHSAEAKAIAEAYGKKMDGLNTAAAIDKLYAQALEEIQAFMDEALWTLDKTGCMTLPKP